MNMNFAVDADLDERRPTVQAVSNLDTKALQLSSGQSRPDILSRITLQDISRRLWRGCRCASQLPVAKRGSSSPQRSVSSIRRRARGAFLAASGFLGEAGASVLIHNYRPLRDGGITAPAQCLPISTLENIPTSGPLFKQAWRCVSNSLQSGILIPRMRDFVREPGPATFVSSCAVFTLCLAHLMQHTSHHRYQNTFILCGITCGVLIGVLTAGHGLILVSAVTAYLPVSIIVAQVLSFFVHTMLLSCPDPVPRRNGSAERIVNSECKKSGIFG